MYTKHYTKYGVALPVPSQDAFEAMSVADKKALGREIARAVASATNWDVTFVSVDGDADELLTFQRTRYRTYTVYDIDGALLAASRIVDRRSHAAGVGVAANLYTVSACAYVDLTVDNIALMLQKGLTRPVEHL